MGEYSVSLLENRCQTLEQIVQSLQAKLKEYTDLGTIEELSALQKQDKDSKKSKREVA